MPGRRNCTLNAGKQESEWAGCQGLRVVINVRSSGRCGDLAGEAPDLLCQQKATLEGKPSPFCSQSRAATQRLHGSWISSRGAFKFPSTEPAIPPSYGKGLCQVRRGQGRAQNGHLTHQDVFLSSPQTLAPGCHAVFIHLLYPDSASKLQGPGELPQLV